MNGTIQNTIKSYARNMGIRDPRSDVFAFRYDSGEYMILEDRIDYLAVSLHREWPEYELGQALENLLCLAAYPATPDYQIQPGLKGDQCLVMNIFLSEEEVSPSRLDGAVRKLRQITRDLDNVDKGGR